MNLYALFEDDRVYFTLSEKAIHSRIEGKDEVADDRFFRLNAFLTGTKAAILRADFAKAEQWLEAMPQDLGQEMAQAYFAGYVEKPYAMEYFSLEQVLGEDFMKEHFMHRPQILGYTPVWQDGKLQWEKDGVIFDQDDNEQLLAHGAELLESAKAIYTAYGKGGLSFAFTPHGAEIRIAFNNPGQEEEDGRFVSMSAEAGVAAMRNKMEETEAISDSDSENPGDTDFKSLLKENQTVLLLGGVAVLVLVVFVVFGRRK